MSPSVASNTRVDRDRLLEFIRPRHRAVLLTRRTVRRRPGKATAAPAPVGKGQAPLWSFRTSLYGRVFGSDRE